MFKPGEKIVFVDDYTLFDNEKIYLDELKIYNIYTAGESLESELVPRHIYNNCVRLSENNNIYYNYRFISLKDFRKRKLLKLMNNATD